MRFKITIITGVFFLLISTLSIAHPISQKEIPPQKIKQIAKKKKQFPLIRSIRNMIRQIRNSRGQKASAWSIISLTLGIAAFPLFATAFLGFVAGGLAVVTGIIGLLRAENARSSLLSTWGIALGGGIIVFALFFVLMVRSLAYVQ